VRFGASRRSIGYAFPLRSNEKAKEKTSAAKKTDLRHPQASEQAA